MFSIATANDGEWELKQGQPSRFTTAYDISVGYTAEDQKYIFVADSSATSHLMWSTDEGSSWNNALTFQDHYFRHIIMQSQGTANGWNGWALVPGLISDGVAGPYKTTNGGQTWERKITGLSDNANLLALASLPTTDMSVAYVGGVSNLHNSHQMLYKWDNTNQQWSLSQANLPTSQDGEIEDIAICEYDPTKMLSAYTGSVLGEAAVYVTSDGGASWGSAGLNGADAVSAVSIGHHFTTMGDDIWPVTASVKSPSSGSWEIRVAKLFSGYPPSWGVPDFSIRYPGLQFSHTHCIRYKFLEGLGSFFYAAFDGKPTSGPYPWVLRWPFC